MKSTLFLTHCLHAEDERAWSSRVHECTHTHTLNLSIIILLNGVYTLILGFGPVWVRHDVDLWDDPNWSCSMRIWQWVLGYWQALSGPMAQILDRLKMFGEFEVCFFYTFNLVLNVNGLLRTVLVIRLYGACMYCFGIVIDLVRFLVHRRVQFFYDLPLRYLHTFSALNCCSLFADHNFWRPSNPAWASRKVSICFTILRLVHDYPIDRCVKVKVEETPVLSIDYKFRVDVMFHVIVPHNELDLYAHLFKSFFYFTFQVAALRLLDSILFNGLSSQ